MNAPPTATGWDFRYLRPGDLRRLEQMLFTPKRLMEGRYSGHFVTAQRGQSVEFRDYREYLPGDEVGRIDWKVFGRTDKLFVRIFEHHAELTVRLLIDASASMAYRGADAQSLRQPSKYDQACRLAAAIGFLVMKQQDRCGLVMAQDGLHKEIPPQRSMQRLMEGLRLMEQTRVRGRAGLAAALDALNRQGARRNLLLVFSDLWDESEATAKALAARVNGGGEIVVFHVLHRDELELPAQDHGVLVDSETGQRLHVNLDEIRNEYRRKALEFADGWSRRCAGLGIDYVRVLTSQPYERVLERYLASRAGR